jgi:hypothetical protein
MTAAAFAAPDTASVPPHLLVGADGQLTHDLLERIRQGGRNAPRSQQRTIGPSGLGHHCQRNLAYHAWQTEPVNDDGDPWMALVGTAAHAWLADTFAGSPRWLVEQRLHIAGQISGSCDLYDLQTGTVIDWKVLGPTSLKDKRKNGPGATYRTQVHLYGYGFEQSGHNPEQVAIMMLPRNGRLRDAHLWTEPYDRQIALDALERYNTVVALSVALHVDENPAMWALVPTDTSNCAYCPFWKPGSTDLGRACPGGTP